MKIMESPNQSPRKLQKIDMIVLHATAGATLDGAVNWMMNPSSKVSAHYCVGKNGNIVQLVTDKNKAWHAGKSSWKNQHDLNENSIGIEIVNLNDGKDEYPEEQLNALAKLVVELTLVHSIPLDRIVGHNQIAPGRKSDPGLIFPWVLLGSKIEMIKNKD